MLTVNQVAEKLQVHQATVRGWIREGKLETIRFGGRNVRVEEKALETFLNASQPN